MRIASLSILFAAFIAGCAGGGTSATPPAAIATTAGPAEAVAAPDGGVVLRPVTPRPHSTQSQSIYVADGNAIKVFSASSNGNAAPLRTIDGRAPGFLAIRAIAVDKHGLLYVADYGNGRAPGSIRIFAAGASGNVAPIRVISGPATQIKGASAVAVDDDGTVYAGEVPTSLAFPAPNGTYGLSSILRFAPFSSGNVAPSASAGSDAVLALALDSTGKNLIVSSYYLYCCTRDIFTVSRDLNFAQSQYLYDVSNFYIGDNGIADDPTEHAYYDVFGAHYAETTSGGQLTLSPPLLGQASIGCGNTTVAGGVAVDASRDLITTHPTGNRCTPRIVVYAPDPTGSVPPIRSIVGARTTLVTPHAIAVGP